MLILIHKQSCPYCAKVRDFLAQKNIDYVSLESESGSPSRALLERLGGKQQVPYLIDWEKGLSMYESGDIIDYLGKNYS